MKTDNKSFESSVFWKVADRIQTIKVDTEEPNWPPYDSIINSFVDDKVWSTKDACKNSIKGYTSKYNSTCFKGLKIKKDNIDKIRKLDIDKFKQIYPWYDEECLNNQTWRNMFSRGSFKPYKCKMFVLPEDDLADKSDTYEEYCIKCDLNGKTNRMSETDFNVYKY